MYTRIVTVGLAALTGLAGLAYLVLFSVTSQHRSFEAQVRTWTMERTSITLIDEISEYRGTETYAVVIGKNRVGTPVIAWMTEDSLEFDQLEGAVSKENVIQAVKQGFPDADMIRVVPGLEGDKRFWEAVFKDSQGRYHYVHYDFYNGSVLKSYRLSAADS